MIGYRMPLSMLSDRMQSVLELLRNELRKTDYTGVQVTIEGDTITVDVQVEDLP